MKVSMIELVRANLAVKEMERQELPYELAAALVKLKRATQKDFEAFLELEKKLVRKYAVLDETGNAALENGHFKFRDLSEAPHTWRSGESWKRPLWRQPFPERQ